MEQPQPPQRLSTKDAYDFMNEVLDLQREQARYLKGIRNVIYFYAFLTITAAFLLFVATILGAASLF